MLHSSASIAAIASLHNYDLAFVVAPLLLLGRLHRSAQLPLVLGVLLIHSARRIAGVVGGADLVEVQAGIATVGGVLMLLGAILTATYGFRRTQPA